MFRPAQLPVTAVVEVRTRRARMPRLVNALLATVKGWTTGPVPAGPAWMTLLLESRRSHLYVSAATCAAVRTLVSPVTRESLLKVMSVDVGVRLTAAANGRTAYFTPLMSMGMSE